MNRLKAVLLIVALALLPPPQPAASRVSICAIQGKWYSSPYENKSVITRGVVFADFDATYQKRFFIQDDGCDANPATSNGLMIYTGQRLDVVQPGDRVEVLGVVQEYYGQTELQVEPNHVTILSRGNPLPAPADLTPPADAATAPLYLEGRESMLVRLSAARLVSPTAADGTAWVAPASLAVEHIPASDPNLAAARLCVDDRGAFTFPAASVGDLAFDLTGVLEVTLGDFCLALTQAPRLEVQPRVVNWPASSGLPRLLTWNLHNLFDASDDPAADDDVLSPAAYSRRLAETAQALSNLGAPALAAVQEVENAGVLQDLTARPEMGRSYRFVLFDGPDARGLDVALLYDPLQVEMLEAASHQGCTTLQDGLEPDGTGDPLNPAMNLTCDRDGDGVLDGSRLFSRPALAVHVRLALSGAGRTVWQPLWVIVVHLKSHLEDTHLQAYTLPRRTEQAQFVANLAAAVQSRSPGEPLFVLGDFNDPPEAASLASLRLAGVFPLSEIAPPESRYTYLFQGLAYVYDDIYLGGSPAVVWSAPQLIHFNADFPAAQRASDHDAVVIDLMLSRSASWLPLIK